MTEQTLSVSTRDAQFLAALTALGSVVLNPASTADMLEHNLTAFAVLFCVHYSGDEANALKQRIVALLPEDGPLILQPVIVPLIPVSSTTLMQ